MSNQNQYFLKTKYDNIAKDMIQRVIDEFKTYGVSTERNEALFVDYVLLIRIFGDIFYREFGVNTKTCPELELARAKVFKQIAEEPAAKEFLNYKLTKEH
jgi:hypothetical protein